MSRQYKNLNEGHAQVLATLDPFQVMDFALHHLAQAISRADGFSVHTHDGGMTLLATHVDTDDNRSGKVSEEPLILLTINPDHLADLVLWNKYRLRKETPKE